VAAAEVCEDADVLGQHLAIDQQGRHAAARVDREVFRLALVARGQVHLDGLVGQAQFLQSDVRGERAGAGRVVELHSHGVLLKGA
jgi:hypothetical protein